MAKYKIPTDYKKQYCLKCGFLQVEKRGEKNYCPFCKATTWYEITDKSVELRIEVE